MTDDRASSASLPAAPASQAKLRAMVEDFPAPGYALVDGGLFDDLPAAFRCQGVFVRSLFLNTADLRIQTAGPWLVRLDQAPGVTSKVFDLIGDKPAAVFWCCADGETVLWHHLRGLNMARIPTWAVDGAVGPPSDPVQAEASEAVMFRHWDPSVLGSFLPVLDAAQFTRILGPAAQIAFEAVDYGGVRRVVRDPAWPAAAPGLLAIRPDQISALAVRRVAASRRRIAAYLRDVTPEHTRDTSDDDLLYQVEYSERVGKKLGIRSERAHAQWAFLMVTSKGQVARHPQVTRFIAASGAPPDRQVDAAMRQSVAAARERDGA